MADATQSPQSPAAAESAKPTPVGWTDARVRRSWTFIALLVAAAGCAAAAMVMPWMTLSLGSAGDACVIGDTSKPVPTYDTSGQPTMTSAAGCISAYQSVHLDKFLGTAHATANPAAAAQDPTSPLGAPEPGVKFGLPSATFWLLAAAGTGALALLMRNALVMGPALLMLKTSFGAFEVHRKALAWGLDGIAHEMYGVTVHQYAAAAAGLGLIVSTVFLVKVNSEQRKVELAEFKDGKRDKPPTLITAQLVAAQMVRGNLDKLSEAAHAAQETAKAK